MHRPPAYGSCEHQQRLRHARSGAVEDFYRAMSLLANCKGHTPEYRVLKGKADAARLHLDNTHVAMQLHCTDHDSSITTYTGAFNAVGADMPFGFTIPHAFSTVSIRAHAPPAPGVYGISNAQEWIYIGEADNIQARLLQHLAASGSAIKAHEPTGFSYEICDPEARTGRHDRLVIEYDPICNRGFGVEGRRKTQ